MAEEKIDFEHRDLHMGNILCKTTREKNICVKLHQNKPVELKTHGVKICIIDYSISSLKFDNIDIGTDLQDEVSFFEGEGDYQFDIYRKMKELLGNIWLKNHNLKTNIFWLHYLITKLLEKVQKLDECSTKDSVIKKLEQHECEILKYGSALDFSEKFIFLNS